MNTIIGSTVPAPQTSSVLLTPTGTAQPIKKARPAGPPAPLFNEKSVKIKSIEAGRYEAVLKAAKDIANVYVVSDRTFTIFKDATGQYVTRFTNLRDGKVSYVPEPQLLKNSGGASLVAIDA